MKLLTNHTLLGLKILTYVSAIPPEERVTVAQISEYYQVSRHHMVKVAGFLAHMGYLKTQRGRHGGVALSRSPASIKLGTLLRVLGQRYSSDCCYNPYHTSKFYQALIDILSVSIESFFAQLNEMTLADIGSASDWAQETIATDNKAI